MVPAAYLDREAAAAVLSARRRSRKSQPLMARAMEFGPLRKMALGKAARKTAEKVSRANYPAPFRAIDSETA